MRKQIRRGVFETNSSSTHSLTICTEEEFAKYQKNEIYYNSWRERFATEEELKEIYQKDRQKYDFDNWRIDEGYYLYEEDDDYLEYYDKHFTTPNGDRMVAFGYYGYN